MKGFEQDEPSHMDILEIPKHSKDLHIVNGEDGTLVSFPTSIELRRKVPMPPKRPFLQTCSIKVSILVYEEMSIFKGRVRFYKVLHCWRCWKRVKAHYGDPLWSVTLYYFLGVCMFEYIPPQTFEKISQYFCILC